ncbi:TPA: hypothetical protein ACT91X_003376 [Proteus mirabilis]
MKKYSAISVLVIILSLMIYLSFYFNQEKENVINCEAKLIIYDKEDTKANLELMFTLGEEQGWASIRGVIDYNGDLIPVYRKSFFDITKLKTSYKLASTQILINDNNSDMYAIGVTADGPLPEADLAVHSLTEIDIHSLF